MRKLYNILIALVAIASFASCTGEVDDIFDRSSADRMTEAIATDRQMLVDAPNGWLMQYFCEDTYGGYNVFVKFNDDNTATVANEVFDLGNRETSHFKLEQSMGVVLSFDEYNELFHFFSTPANPNGIGDDGIGMRVDSLSLSSNGEWTAQGEISLLPVVPALVDQLLDTGTYWSFVQGRMSQLAARYFQRAEQASADEDEEVMFMALGVNPNAPNLGWSFFFRYTSDTHRLRPSGRIYRCVSGVAVLHTKLIC